MGYNYPMTKSESPIVKRLKSLLWRAGMMAVAAFAAYLTANIADLHLAPSATVLLGLVLGEVSKWLNTRV